MTKMDQIIDYDKKIAATERHMKNNKKLIAIVAAIVLAFNWSYRIHYERL